MTAEQKNFIEMIGNAAVSYYKTYGILPSLTIAQAILESAWGKSGLSRDCFNYFGMKWKKNCGCDYKEYYTKEQNADGSYVTITAKFRKYKNVEDGIKGYYIFLSGYKRYANLKGVTDASLACDLIRQDGWATSLAYATNLKNLIAKYNLTEYDAKVIGQKITVSFQEDVFAVGNYVVTASALRVRTGPGTSFPQKKFNEMTVAAQNVNAKKKTTGLIRLMFDLAEKGIWVGKIKTYLQKHNFKTGNGCEWIDAAVYRVLRNPDYTGDRTLQKSYQDAMRIRHKNKGQVPKWIITNDHPAIVSKEQWERVQTVLDKRSEELKDKTPINTDKPNSRSTYPLSGKMFCPYCGKVLMHRYENGRRREMWVCRTFQKVHPRTCRGIRVPNAVASEWGELTEPVTVIESNDEYGMQHFTAYPKAEYEASAECPYDQTPVEKPKKVKIEKAKKPRGGQQIRPHRQKPEVREDSHSKYALSGKLYCPYCSKVLTHKWDDLIEYWVCSTNRNLHRKFSDGIRCKGFYFPAELAIPWGEVNEKLTVVAYTDDNGKKQYTAYPKDEYERMKACTTIENRKDGKTYGKEDNTDSTETEK